MAESSNTERDIGRLQGQMESVHQKLDALSALIKDQGVHSDESRAKLYERVGHLEQSIEISGHIDAQVRDRLDHFEHRIDKEVMPTVDEVKRWRAMGIGALGIIGIGGTALGGFLAQPVWELVQWIVKKMGGP